MRQTNSVRPEPVEGRLSQGLPGFDKLSPNGVMNLKRSKFARRVRGHRQLRNEFAAANTTRSLPEAARMRHDLHQIWVVLHKPDVSLTVAGGGGDEQHRFRQDLRWFDSEVL
jgi:hypothetical protein